MADPTGVTRLATQDLYFDHHNPRLVEFGITAKTSEAEIVQILWDAMDVRELVQSIAASGFFAHEALIVVNEAGRHIVIEGNRRLAAVKVLLSHGRVLPDGTGSAGGMGGTANIGGTSSGEPVPQLSPEAYAALESLPVIISSREQSWRYLGFKHVNGPAKWSSYAKAAYIAQIHRQYQIPLANIAEQIGDRHNTVARLYRGLMVLEQAERAKVFDREDRFRSRLAFSHLYTGLDYESIADFLSIAGQDAASPNPVPSAKIRELGELMLWLYGSRRNKVAPVIESQNPDLRRLSAVLANREAIAALRAGAELSDAFEISRPPTTVFEEALLAAKRELTTARANLTTGYDRSEALLRIAGSIAEMADDIYREMERKQTPKEKKARLTEK